MGSALRHITHGDVIELDMEICGLGHGRHSGLPSYVDGPGYGERAQRFVIIMTSSSPMFIEPSLYLETPLETSMLVEIYGCVTRWSACGTSRKACSLPLPSRYVSR